MSLRRNEGRVDRDTLRSRSNSPSEEISDWQVESLKGFSIPKNMKESPPKKSLAESINEKLLNMAQQPAEQPADKKGNFSCGKKRTFEEMSGAQKWSKEYDKLIPDDIMLLCAEDQCHLCGVDITSSCLRDAHYNGSKHEKKVRAKLAEIFPNDEDRPRKKAKGQLIIQDGVSAAMDFLRKIEDQVERDPTKVTYGDIKLEEWQKFWLEKWDRPIPAAIVSMCRIMKCDICEASFNSGIMAKSHYEGKNHEKKLTNCLKIYCTQHNLALPQRVTTEAEAIFQGHCNVCDVKLSSEADARIHYAGKNHIAKKLKQMSRGESSDGRFGIGAGFGSSVKSDPQDEQDDLRDVLKSSDEGLDGTWGARSSDTSKPVPLMSLDVRPPRSIAANYFDDVRGVAGKMATEYRVKNDYSCEVCGLECLGSKQSYEGHIQGAKHKKRVKEQLEGGGGESFYCDICNVTSPNQSAFEVHIRGKQHARRRDRDETEERVEGKYKY